MKTILTTPALRRRAVYLIIAAALMLGLALGKLTPEQADSWTTTAMAFYDQIAPFISAGALAVAARKATPAADDPTTKEDVEVARKKAATDAHKAAMRDVRRTVDAAVKKATGNSALPTYHGPTVQ